MEELGVQLSFTEYEVGEDPLPERGTTKGELLPLLITVKLPESEPVAAGSKVTLIDVD